VIVYLFFMTTRGLQGPLLATVIQADAPAEDRASVLSLNALCFRLAFVVCGPPIGALVDRIGLEPSLGVLGLGFAVAATAALTAFGRAHAATSR
jgi:predicted MFS family arabinose efflux permease